MRGQILEDKIDAEGGGEVFQDAGLVSQQVSQHAGLVPRCLSYIFSKITELRARGSRVSIKVCVCARVRAFACLCMCVCVRASTHALSNISTCIAWITRHVACISGRAYLPKLDMHISKCIDMHISKCIAPEPYN